MNAEQRRNALINEYRKVTNREPNGYALAAIDARVARESAPVSKPVQKQAQKRPSAKKPAPKTWTPTVAMPPSYMDTARPTRDPVTGLPSYLESTERGAKGKTFDQRGKSTAPVKPRSNWKVFGPGGFPVDVNTGQPLRNALGDNAVNEAKAMAESAYRGERYISSQQARSGYVMGGPGGMPVPTNLTPEQKVKLDTLLSDPEEVANLQAHAANKGMLMLAPLAAAASPTLTGLGFGAMGVKGLYESSRAGTLLENPISTGMSGLMALGIIPAVGNVAGRIRGSANKLTSLLPQPEPAITPEPLAGKPYVAYESPKTGAKMHGEVINEVGPMVVVKSPTGKIELVAKSRVFDVAEQAATQLLPEPVVQRHPMAGKIRVGDGEWHDTPASSSITVNPVPASTPTPKTQGKPVNLYKAFDDRIISDFNPAEGDVISRHADGRVYVQFADGRPSVEVSHSPVNVEKYVASLKNKSLPNLKREADIIRTMGDGVKPRPAEDAALKMKLLEEEFARRQAVDPTIEPPWMGLYPEEVAFLNGEKYVPQPDVHNPVQAAPAPVVKPTRTPNTQKPVEQPVVEEPVKRIFDRELHDVSYTGNTKTAPDGKVLYEVKTLSGGEIKYTPDGPNVPSVRTRPITDPLSPKQRALVREDTRKSTEEYYVRLIKQMRHEPLTLKEAEEFRPGVPEGYVKSGDQYVFSGDPSITLSQFELTGIKEMERAYPDLAKYKVTEPVVTPPVAPAGEPVASADAPVGATPKKPRAPRKPKTETEPVNKLSYSYDVSSRVLQKHGLVSGKLGDAHVEGGDIIRLDGKPVGWMKTDENGVLLAIEIKPEYQKQGIARRVLLDYYDGNSFTAFMPNEYGDALNRSIGKVEDLGDGFVRVTPGGQVESKAQAASIPVEADLVKPVAERASGEQLPTTTPAPVAPAGEPAVRPVEVDTSAVAPAKVERPAATVTQLPNVGDQVRMREGGPVYTVSNVTNTKRKSSFTLKDAQGREQTVPPTTPWIKVETGYATRPTAPYSQQVRGILNKYHSFKPPTHGNMLMTAKQAEALRKAGITTDEHISAARQKIAEHDKALLEGYAYDQPIRKHRVSPVSGSPANYLNGATPDSYFGGEVNGRKWYGNRSMAIEGDAPAGYEVKPAPFGDIVPSKWGKPVRPVVSHIDGGEHYTVLSDGTVVDTRMLDALISNTPGATLHLTDVKTGKAIVAVKGKKPVGILMTRTAPEVPEVVASINRIQKGDVPTTTPEPVVESAVTRTPEAVEPVVEEPVVTPTVKKPRAPRKPVEPEQWDVEVSYEVTLPGRKPTRTTKIVSVSAKTQKGAIKAVVDSGVKSENVVSATRKPKTEAAPATQKKPRANVKAEREAARQQAITKLRETVDAQEAGADTWYPPQTTEVINGRQYLVNTHEILKTAGAESSGANRVRKVAPVEPAVQAQINIIESLTERERDMLRVMREPGQDQEFPDADTPSLKKLEKEGYVYSDEIEPGDIGWELTEKGKALAKNIEEWEWDGKITLKPVSEVAPTPVEPAPKPKPAPAPTRATTGTGATGTYTGQFRYNKRQGVKSPKEYEVKNSETGETTWTTEFREDMLPQSVSEYTSGFDKLKAGKVTATLNAPFMRDGVLTTRGRFVEDSIANGATIEISQSGKRELTFPDGSFFDGKEITSTALDYAEYLISRKKTTTPSKPAETGVTGVLKEKRRNTATGKYETIIWDISDISAPYKDGANTSDGMWRVDFTRPAELGPNPFVISSRRFFSQKAAKAWIDEVTRTTTTPKAGGKAGSGKKKESGGTAAFTGEAVLPRSQTRATTTAATAESIVRASDIVADLDKAFAPIRTGRVGGKRSRLGVFRHGPETIRTRIANNLSVIAHEVGHALNRMLWPGKGTKSSHTELLKFKDELAPLDYEPKGRVSEGYAEFVRYYLTDPAQAKHLAPNFYTFFEETLAKHPEVAKVLAKAQADIARWVQQPANARVRSTIVDGSTKESVTVGSMWEVFYRQMVDEANPIRLAEEAITGKKADPSNPKSGFYQNWVNRGRAGRAEVAIHDGFYDSTGMKKIGESLKDALKPVEGDWDGWSEYAISRHMLDVIDSGKPAPLDRADYQAVVDAAPPHYQQVLDRVVEFQDRVLDVLVDGGLLSPDAKAAMRTKWPNHVPLYRDMGTGPRGAGRGIADVSNPVHRLKGSGRNIIDPIQSIIKDTFQLMDVAARNKAMQKLVDQAAENPGAGRWIEPVPAKMRGTTTTLEELLNRGEVNDAIDAGLDISSDRSIFRPQVKGNASEHIVTVFRNGKAELYQLDPALYDAVTATDSASAGILEPLIRFSSGPSKLLRATATGLNPAFFIRNTMRDTVNALVTSDVTPVDLVRGLFHTVRGVLKGDELYTQFKASGGAHAVQVAVDQNFMKVAARRMKSRTVRDYIIDFATHPFDAIRTLGEIAETNPRLTKFAKDTKWGKETDPGKIQAAVIAARDLGIDFSRAGRMGKQYNRITAFFNAAIGGADRTARAFKNQPAQTMVKGAAYITAPTVILYAMNRNDEHYKELPEWEKDAFWHIPVGDGRFVRVPRPFELGVIFGALPERVLRWADEQDPKAFDKFAETLSGQLPNILPTIIQPIWDIWGNKGFTGAPIVPRSEEYFPPELQFGPNTSETAKAIGGAINKSPRQIDYAIRGYTAALGQLTVDNITDPIISLYKGSTDKIPPAGRLTEGVFGKSFVTGPWNQSKAVEDLYDERKKLTDKKALAEAGRTKITTQELARLKSLNKGATDLSKLRKSERLVRAENDPNKVRAMGAAMGLSAQDGDPAEIKRALLLEIRKRMGDVARKRTK